MPLLRALRRTTEQTHLTAFTKFSGPFPGCFYLTSPTSCNLPFPLTGIYLLLSLLRLLRRRLHFQASRHTDVENPVTSPFLPDSNLSFSLFSCRLSSWLVWSPRQTLHHSEIQQPLLSPPIDPSPSFPHFRPFLSLLFSLLRLSVPVPFLPPKFLSSFLSTLFRLRLVWMYLSRSTPSFVTQTTPKTLQKAVSPDLCCFSPRCMGRPWLFLSRVLGSSPGLLLFVVNCETPPVRGPFAWRSTPLHRPQIVSPCCRWPPSCFLSPPWRIRHTSVSRMHRCLGKRVRSETEGARTPGLQPARRFPPLLLLLLPWLAAPGLPF